MSANNPQYQADSRLLAGERTLKREQAARVAIEALLEQQSRSLQEANQKLTALAADLEQRVDDRTRELVTARELAIAMAEQDGLTGLANRTCFGRIVSETIEQSRATNSRFALLLVDLDRFKSINDTLGHDGGDAVLKHLAHQLKLAAGSRGTAVRLGGDEFAIVVPFVTSARDAEDIAHTIIRGMKEPIAHRDRRFAASCSIGLALFPDDAANAVDLQRYADIALCRSKQTGQGISTTFDAEINEQLRLRRSLENDLRRALAEGEIQPWFQPVVDAGAHVPRSAEVLARWHHPKRGVVMPGAFLNIVESCGLMDDMFTALTRQSCLIAKPWIDSRRLRSIAINVSPSQFRSGRLVDSVLAILDETKFNPTALVLEITEEVLLTDMTSASAQVESLASYGIKTALDDFGSGYANVGYLRRLPLRFLKLDRSLTMDVATDDKARAIVRAVNDIANALDLDVVAEGIETDAQALWLGRLGCRFLQGYYFGRPMPAEGFAAHNFGVEKDAVRA